MKIVRERPCQNRHHEVTAPLDVVLPSGQCIRAEKWSLGGVSLIGISEKFPKIEDKILLQLQLPFQGFDIKFDVEAIATKTDAQAKSAVLEFINLSERAHDLLVHFLDDLIRGKMATVDDTICRIDVPVTPISTKPDPKPEVEVVGRKWPVNTIAMSFFYSILGCLVFGYLGILIYSNTMRIEVRSAVLSAPVTTIKMPVDGIIKPVRFERGMMVEAGDTIARIESPQLLSRIEDKRIELLAAKRKQRRIQEKYRIEESRMKLYQVISRTDRQIAEARVEAARGALRAADAAVERLSVLFKKNLVPATRFDTEKKQRVEAEQRLKHAEHELERKVAMDASSDRRYFNHKEFVSDLDMMSLEVAEADEEVESVSLQLDKLERLRETMAIRAPYDGRIVAVMQAGNTTVLRNSNLFAIEQSQEMSVTAFVDQDQILSIGLNDTAKVFLPSLGLHAAATVLKVDRSSAFLNPERSQYTWRDGRQKNAAVSLTLQIPNEHQFKVSAGLPAIVIFPKRSVNDIYDRVWSFFQTKQKVKPNGLPI